MQSVGGSSLKVLSVACVAALLLMARTEAAQKPNIVLMFLPFLRFELVRGSHCVTGVFIESVHADRLSKRISMESSGLHTRFN